MPRSEGPRPRRISTPRGTRQVTADRRERFVCIQSLERCASPASPYASAGGRAFGDFDACLNSRQSEDDVNEEEEEVPPRSIAGK